MCLVKLGSGYKEYEFIVVYEFYWDGQMKDISILWTETRNLYRILLRQSLGKRIHETSRIKWRYDNNKMDRSEMNYEDVN
jgi:hypothetical protein